VYIDFETEEGERDSARWLYEWLISLSGHVKVWTSYVLFEAEPIPVPRAEREEGEEEDDEDAEPKAIPGDANLARQVFGRGNKDLKSKGLKSEVSTLCCDFVGFHFSRIALCFVEVWETFEENNGSSEGIARVQGMMPIVSKRQHVDRNWLNC